MSNEQAMFHTHRITYYSLAIETKTADEFIMVFDHQYINDKRSKPVIKGAPRPTTDVS